MKKLTITFDNGPDPECTPGVLEALAARDVKASFFVCGQGNGLHPANKANTSDGMTILSEAVEQGHWVGNHSLTHTVELGTTIDPEVIAREIGRNEEMLGSLNEHRLFRPYMGGGVLGPRTFSPPAIDYLCAHGYTAVLFNCLPRDWELASTWPEEAFEIASDQEWTVVVVHDVARYGSMGELGRFIDTALDRGVEIVQEFPDDCVPIRAGRVTMPLQGMVCGDAPEPATKISRAAAQQIH